MNRRVVLDPHCENSPELGYVEVQDEVSFLRSLTCSESLFVRGPSLCNWAADVARARGWQFSWRTAPSIELAHACHSMTQEQAKTFILRIGSLDTFTRPLSLLDLAVARWPEIDPEGKSETEQAWSWLLWRAHANLSPDEEAFALTLGACYQSENTPELRSVFSVSSADEAWLLMRMWLHCDGYRTELPNHPEEELPPWAVNRFVSEWKRRAVETSGDFFRELLDAGAPNFILKLAAGVAFAFHRNNADTLRPASLELLRPFLRFQDWQALRDLLPVNDPGSIPASLPDVLAWFSERYLPFRLRRRDTSDYTRRVLDLGREFGLWYLRFYSNARAGGTGGSLLSWSRTAALSSTSGSLNLLIVLDGLGYSDAQQTTSFISAEAPRLSFDESEILLAPLPTITRFAKPSLVSGVTPVQAIDEGELGGIQTRDPEVISALNRAKPGDLVIWSLLEPDKTYHSGLDERTIRSEVQGRLRSIAQRVSRIVEEVDQNKRLRICVTTDHGRLLSSSRRVQAVPFGMKAHGRAAWGGISVPFDSDGIYVDGDVAYIDAQRFGLPVPAAIMMSDDAFLMSDGRTGMESFPHGGVFPEEVLIPWLQFTRDRGPVTLSITITGKGVAGASGRIRLEITNTSEVRIEVVQLAILTLNVRKSVSLIVGPFRQATAEWPLAPWPQNKDITDLQAVLTYILPTGERQDVQTTPALVTEEMYSRDTTLDDLL